MARHVASYHPPGPWTSVDTARDVLHINRRTASCQWGPRFLEFLKSLLALLLFLYFFVQILQVAVDMHNQGEIWGYLWINLGIVCLIAVLSFASSAMSDDFGQKESKALLRVPKREVGQEDTARPGRGQ